MRREGEIIGKVRREKESAAAERKRVRSKRVSKPVGWRIGGRGLTGKTGIREQGSGKTGIREQGSGNRDQGTGNRDQGTGIREQGTGIREQGTGNREQRTENREQRTENREQRTEVRDQGREPNGLGFGWMGRRKPASRFLSKYHE
jgi:hypothetical protein